MSSTLRYSSTPSATTQTPNIRQPRVASPPPKKQKMSLTQTYMLATVARRQLQKEAARPDHDLRLLVGHANLLDGLMLDLAHAEQEQESWFNQSVSSAAGTTTTITTEQPKHVQWADSHTIPEEAVEEDIYDEDDSDDDSDDEPIPVAPRTVRSKAPQITTTAVLSEDDEEEDQEMDDDFDEELTLTRSPSHSASPPELLHEDSEDSESEDDSMPPSPPSTDFPLNVLSQKQRQAIATTSLYQSNTSDDEEESASLFDQERQPMSIAAY